MAKKLQEIELRLLPNLDSITEPNFLAYFFWQRSSSLIRDIIISKFEEGLIKETGFNETNIPNEEKKTNIPISSYLEFIVTTTPRSKQISQSTVLEELFAMITLLKSQYDQGISREGILTLESQPFLNLDEIVDKYNGLMTFKETKKSISNTINSNPDLEEIPLADVIKFLIGKDYSRVTEENSRLYLKSKKFVKEGDKRASEFKKTITLSALSTIGLSDEEQLTEVTLVGYTFDQYTLVAQLEPRNVPRYSEILNSLFRVCPKQIKSNSKIGDLEKARLIGQGQQQLLLEKGLVDSEYLETYKPLTRDGKVYVKLNGLVLRLKEYQDRYTSRKVELNLGIIPT